MYKKIMMLFAAILIGITACQPQFIAVQQPAPTLAVSPTLTPAPSATTSPTPTRQPQPTLAWEERNLTGKIVYVDRTANQIVVMDANGENAREISYLPGETYEPYLGSPVKWSPDGRKIAFGCQKLDPLDWEFFPSGRGDGVRLSLCILDMVENLQGQTYTISDGLHVIELPEEYTPDFSEGVHDAARLFSSLSWILEGEALVLTPFCLVRMEETQTDCSDWDDLDSLGEGNKTILREAEFIAPSPADPRQWAVAIRNQVLIMDLVTGEVDQVEMEYERLFLYWSPDGRKIAVQALNFGYLYASVVGVLDVQEFSFAKIIWEGELNVVLEPGLITARPGTGSYSLSPYFPRSITAWSPDSRYLSLSVYLIYSSLGGSKIYSGIYYFDFATRQLFPARRGSDELGIPTEFRPEYKVHIVKFDELQLFTSPDWYACNDPENVCDLYK